MKRIVIAAVLLTGLGLQGAQAQDSVGNVLTGGAKVDGVVRNAALKDLPVPDIVLVREFAVPISNVTMDNSVAARLRRHRTDALDTTDA
jgi:hypothetical protein